MRLRARLAAIPTGRALFAYDLLATSLSVFLSLVLRFETFKLSDAVLPFLPAALLPILARPFVGLAFGLYRREWRYASTRELGDIVGSVAVGSIVILVLYGFAWLLSMPGRCRNRLPLRRR